MTQHIHDIEIKNFKSIRHQKIEDCRRVNVFVGYPNVGKSNILEAVSLLTFIRQNRPSGLKNLVRLEKLSQLFHSYNVEDLCLIKYNGRYTLEVFYDNEEHLKLSLMDDKNSDEFTKLYKRVAGLQLGINSLISGKTNGRDDFSGWMPETDKVDVKPYKFSNSNSFNQSYSAKELSIPTGENLFEVIISNKIVREEFSELLKYYGFKMLIDVSDNSISVTSELSTEIIYKFPFSLLADTLTRLIFFKTAIHSSKNAVLLLEEPEAHMFPPYISKLTADIMYDEGNNQYFIATHSPFVLNDFMEHLDKEELAIYAVGYKKESGETIVRRMLDEEVTEIYQYGIDLFFNLENYLKDAV